jgi:hypothetical protein
VAATPPAAVAIDRELRRIAWYCEMLCRRWADDQPPPSLAELASEEQISEDEDQALAVIKSA